MRKSEARVRSQKELRGGANAVGWKLDAFMLKCCSIVTLLLSASVLLDADVTVRQSFDYKMNLPIPGAQVPQLPFREILMRIKGDRAYSETGTMNSITDAATGQVTMLDPKTSRYATATLAEYVAALEQAVSANAMPEQAKAMLSQIKVDVDSHDTGRTERIQGVDAAEREIVTTLTIPIPIPGQEKGMRVVVKIDMWKPAPGAAERVPWLREMTSFYSRTMDVNNPFTMLRQMFTAIGLGQGMDKMVREMASGGAVTLRMHMAVLMPDLANLMGQARARGADVPAMPAGDAPLMELTTEVKEVNTEPVPDTAVEIPASYRKVPIEDLVKGLMPAAPKQ
jgi:hypothetical protein